MVSSLHISKKMIETRSEPIWLFGTWFCISYIGKVLTEDGSTTAANWEGAIAPCQKRACLPLPLSFQQEDLGRRLTKPHVLSPVWKILNHCLEYALGVVPALVMGGAESPVASPLESTLHFKMGGSAVRGLGPCFSPCPAALLKTESAS